MPELFSLLLLVNATTTPIAFDCQKTATSTYNCGDHIATSTTEVTTSVTVQPEVKIVKEYATTTVEKIIYRWRHPTTTVEKIVYVDRWHDRPTTTIEKIVEKIVYVPRACPATTTPPVWNWPTTTKPVPPKIEERIEKQIDRLEKQQEKTIERMEKQQERVQNRFERLIERLRNLLQRV